MTRSLWKYFGRGFVALALVGASAGCGDDDDAATMTKDAGPSAGKGGSSAKAGTSGGGTGGSAGKPSVTVAMCKTDTTKAVTEAGALTPAACVNCACGEASNVVDACDSGCWTLIACVSTQCPTAVDAALTACVTNGGPCAAAFAKGGNAALVGKVLTGACASTCVPAAPIVDGGTTPETDAGTTTPTADAGS